VVVVVVVVVGRRERTPMNQTEREICRRSRVWHQGVVRVREMTEMMAMHLTMIHSMWGRVGVSMKIGWAGRTRTRTGRRTMKGVAVVWVPLH
jgi:hypothetical protein